MNCGSKLLITFLHQTGLLWYFSLPSFSSFFVPFLFPISILTKFVGLFEKCESADNYLPILEYYKTNPHMLEEVPDLENYVEFTYNHLGRPEFAEMQKVPLFYFILFYLTIP